MKNSLKTLGCVVFLSICMLSCSTSASVFELNPKQSMSITGKGAGQDAAFNPYQHQNSIAIVKNTGANVFSVRIERGGKLLEQVDMESNETKEFNLKQNDALYLDSKLVARAKVSFKKS